MGRVATDAAGMGSELTLPTHCCHSPLTASGKAVTAFNEHYGTPTRELESCRHDPDHEFAATRRYEPNNESSECNCRG